MGDKRTKTFFSYVIPSVLAFALSGVYSIVDGLFIGNSIGDAGLSTISIAYPVVSLMQAIGTGIGMGGAVLYSIADASGDKQKAEQYAGGTGAFLLTASIIVTVLLYLGATPILRVLGAQGEILALGQEYLGVMVLGSVFQIFSTGIVPMIRNHKGATFAMISMVAGFVTNIILDYLFVWVFEWGMPGAAGATLIGQAVTAIAGVSYLLVRKLPVLRFYGRRSLGLFGSIVKVGFAPFGLTLTPSLSLIFMNRYCLMYGGDKAVASYACIAYALTLAYMFVQGAGDGSQPLMSRRFGEGDQKEFRAVRRLAYGTSAGLAVLGILILFIGRYQIGRLFGASEEVMIETGNIMPIFLVGVMVLAFTRVTTSSFYATEQNMFSYILVYAEPVFLILFLLLFPRFWGQSGVWWSMCASQVMSAVLALILKKLSDRKSFSVSSAS